MRTVVVGSSINLTIVVSAITLVLATPLVARAQDVTAQEVTTPAASQVPPIVPPTQPPVAKAPADPNKKAPEPQKPGASNDRLFGILPNFMTVNGQDVTPLTTKQKYSLVAQGTFDVVEYPWYATMAGISQANDSEAGYGVGLTGYTKRYAAAFADYVKRE